MTLNALDFPRPYLLPVHGLTGVTCGSGNPWVGDGMGGKTIGLNSGNLGGSGFGVTTGIGTSKPGFLADVGLVFSTGGSWKGEELGFGRSGT